VTGNEQDGVSPRPRRSDDLMVIPAPRPRSTGLATSADGIRIAWYRYGAADRAVLFIPTWNLVDARVVGHQVTALAAHATVVTYDPRGAGASDRPEHGYTFPLHAADAVAVMDAVGIERAAVVTASRGLNAAILLATDQPQRVERIAAIAPYMRLEPDPEPPDPERLDDLRTDWPGFIGPFMRLVFSEPDSGEVIEQMIGIGMDSTPGVVATQETELEWTDPARRLGRVEVPTLVIHGEADAAVPLSLAESITAAMPNARLVVIPDGGHRPDIRNPELVNPPLIEFLLAR
jgi:pimeloyl-ACP methyl ester carboxylesterase